MTPPSEYLENFLEKVPLGVLVLHPDLTVKNANGRALDLLSLGVEDLLLDSSGGTLRQRLDPLFRALEAGGPTIHNIGIESGGRFLSITASREKGDAAGSGVVVVIEDRTDSRRLDALKEEFLSTLLHKLRSPLTTLKTSLSVLSAQDLSAMPPAFSEVLAMCGGETARLNALLNALRDVFYIETGLAARELELESVEAAAAAERALKMLRGLSPSGEEAVQRIRVMAPGACKVRADFEKLTQVFYCLLKNALTYSAAGAPVDLRIRTQAGQAAIEVHDRGPGIPAAELPRIFEKYYRGARAAAGESQGDGFGLFIAKSFVELMGGTLFCDSREGTGSVFSLLLPLAGGETRREAS